MSGATFESGLTYIEVESENPVNLFNEWRTEAKTYSNFANSDPNAMSMATVDKDGRVHNRFLILRGIQNDNFLIMTDNRSKKCCDLAGNPCVALTFLWIYTKENVRFSRQVRIEGVAQQLGKEKTEALYDAEPLFCKIRSYVCHQDVPVDWDELKKHHDKVLDEVKAGKSLPMPDHFVAFEIVPHSFDFYSSEGHTIADRVKFDKDNNIWRHGHIAA